MATPTNLLSPWTHNMNEPPPERISLNPHDAAILDAVFKRMFPADDDGPDAADIGVTDYVDKALRGAYADLQLFYRNGLAVLDREMLSRSGKQFTAASPTEQGPGIQALGKNYV